MTWGITSSNWKQGSFLMCTRYLKSFLFFLFVFLLCVLHGGEFRIAATADLHGNLRNLSLLAYQIRREAPDLLLDAGDLTGGNLLAELDGGRSMIEALNLLKYDFMVPGNHDFDLPQRDLARRCRDFKGVTLGGDWRWGDVGGVPRRIVTKGNFRVGIIGLTEPNISRRHLPLAEAPSFKHWKKVLEAQLEALKKEQVHFTVLLWHNGVGKGNFSAKALLKGITGIDLVIGAHTHEEHSGFRSGKSYMVQPGAHGTSAALVTLQYNDRTFAIEKVESTLLRGVPGKGDPAIDLLSKRAVKPYYPAIYRPICRRGDLSARNLPRLGAAALRLAGKTQGALFSANIPHGKSAHYRQYRDLFRLMPYWTTLCTVTVTRSELKALLEDLQRNAPKFKKIIGFSGFSWHRGVLKAPPRITLTVSSYMMVTSPVLRRILHEKVPRWRHTGIVEREAVVSFLSRQGR